MRDWNPVVPQVGIFWGVALTRKQQRFLLWFFAIAIVWYFFIANRASYRGFFPNDDLDNIANARGLVAADYAKALVRPDPGGDGYFRAVGYFFYTVLSRIAGLRFWPYVAAIQIIHLVNVLLVFLLARAVGARPFGACAAALLFVFHAAALDIYWQPMYVFDLLCATFTLICLLAYVYRQMTIAIVSFWLAIKCKETCILLPVVLALLEFWLGSRKWKRLIPFAAISGVILIFAFVGNAHRDSDYTFRFTFAAFKTCVLYYARALAFAPYVGLAVLAVPFIVFSNRRVRWGIATFVLFLAPLLFLPGRLYEAYLYLPLIGLAIAVSFATPLLAVLLFAAWLPWNYMQIKPYRNQNLAWAAERFKWFQATRDLVAAHPETERFVYDSAPESLTPLGITGALRALRPPEASTYVAAFGSPEARDLFGHPPFALLTWDSGYHALRALAGVTDVAYIRLDSSAPAWQLEDGWSGNQGPFRWMEPIAKARLLRPTGSRRFEVLVYVSQVYIERLHESRFEVLINGTSLGTQVLREAKPTRISFAIPNGSEKTAQIEFRVTPPLVGADIAGALGQPIGGFGFVE
jgi:hypothetical protein